MGFLPPDSYMYEVGGRKMKVKKLGIHNFLSEKVKESGMIALATIEQKMVYFFDTNTYIKSGQNLYGEACEKH